MFRSISIPTPTWRSLRCVLFCLVVLLFAVGIGQVSGTNAASIVLSPASPTTYCDGVTEIPQSECDTLVTLYESTAGSDWRVNTGWLTTNTPCSWFGVSCDQGHVTELALDNNKLDGSIPASIAQLTQLRMLDLNSNRLHDAIPETIGHLTELQILALYFNDLSGLIPVELGNLVQLRELLLVTNQLTGSIPSTFGNLANLQQLALVNNQLSGPIPPELGELTNLAGLYLQVNRLSGPIPAELGNLVNLTGLGLNHNELTGPIPSSLGNLEKLTTLDLELNYLSGQIPPELGNLTKLSYLTLAENHLRGEVPQALTQLIELSALRINYNCLSATDPTVSTWLAALTPGWDTTQTVPPTAITAGPFSNGQILLSWTPIPYVEDLGYYEISYATTPAGPFTVHGTTADKQSQSYILTGLMSDRAYFARVRTYTYRENWRHANELWSDYSEVIAIQTGEEPSNLLINGNFEAGSEPWRFYTNGEGTFTAAGPAYEGNAAARVEIIKKGSNTQLYQTGFTLEPRTRYRLSFAAYSGSGHDLSLYVHQHDSPYTYYGLRNFRLNLTTGWQAFSLEFKTKNFTMPTDDTRLRLWFKPFAINGDVYWIDNIVLEKMDAHTATAGASSDIVDTISGTLQLPTGHTDPVTLTLVDLETEGQAFTRSTTTATDGTFHFTDLPAGTYELQATPPQGLLTPEPYQFQIGESEHEDFILVMEPAASTLYLPLIAR